MLNLGLTEAQLESYFAALRDSHRIRVEVALRNRNEKPVDALSAPINRVVSGSVQVDATADVTRSLDLTVLDPKRQLRFEGHSPANGAVFGDTFVSVRYGVYVDSTLGWVDCPVFWGPVTGFQRQGGQVTIEGQGKERLMLAPHFATKGYTLGKRLRIDEAVKRIARHAGEQRFDVPRISRTLQEARPVSARSEPWKVLSGGAEDASGKRVPGVVERANRHAFYDGRGRLCVRRRSKQASWTFAAGRDLLSQPGVTYDNQDFINTVVVRGKERAKGKPRAHGRAMLAAGHPLSPQSLGRNSEPRHMTEFVETELKTDSECRERARQILKRSATRGVEASFEALPVPFLEELDMVRLHTDEYDFRFPLRQWTLPLTASESMSVGANKRVRRGPRHSHGSHR